MARKDNSWEYVGLWRYKEIKNQKHFSVFRMFGKIVSSDNGYELINGRGIDKLGNFLIDGRFDKKQEEFILHKEYFTGTPEVLKHIEINAKRVGNYFEGKWVGFGESEFKYEGGIVLRKQEILPFQLYFEGDSLENELLKANLILLQDGIEKLKM